MRWSTLLPLAYLSLCGWYALQSQLSGGSPAERWLPLQGLTLPWGIALSYLPEHDQWPELGLAGLYLGAALLNALLLLVGIRFFARVIARVERLDDHP